MKKILSVFILLIFAASAFAAPPALPPDGPYTAVDCNQAQFYALGKLCVDSSGKLWKGTGSGVEEIASYNASNNIVVGSSSAGKNLTVNATLTSIFTHSAANYNEDGATWTITGTGPLVHVTGNTTALTATPSETIVAGTTYRVTITGTGGGGTATWTFAGYSGTPIAASGSIAIENYFVASNTNVLVITPASGCTVSISSITIEKLTSSSGNAYIGGNLYVRSPFYTQQIIAGVDNGAPGYPNITLQSNALGVALYGRSNCSFRVGIDSIYASIPSTGSVGIVGTDVLFTRMAADTLAMRRSAYQQSFQIYNTADATGTNTNYERGVYHGVAGYSINRTAQSAGTGADNLDVLDTPAGAGGVGVRPPTEATGGGFVTRVANGSVTLSGASGTITLSPVIPTGSRIRSIQLRVNTAITSGDGATTWTAAYTNTPTTAIGSGYAFTKNTKPYIIHAAHEKTTDAVAITVTPNSGTFSAGVVEAFVYYEDFVALADAP